MNVFNQDDDELIVYSHVVIFTVKAFENTYFIYLTVSCSSSPDSLLTSGISSSKTSLKYPGPSSISADPVTQAKGFFSTFYPVKNQTSESFWNI